MTAWAYYNEIDPFAVETLRTLLGRNMIAPGVVDTRSIEDVTPDDLREFTQCHFFAGLGLWSKAARDAGWPDDRELWSASCPCQPFSNAGAREGFADERHLWPATHWLIQQRRPSVIVGEQVAGADAKPWFDLVCDDMAGVDYAVRAQVAAAAGYGAPMVSERLYWMAAPAGGRHEHGDGRAGDEIGRQGPRTGASGRGLHSGMASTDGERYDGRGAFSESRREEPENGCRSLGMAAPDGTGLPERVSEHGIQRTEARAPAWQAPSIRGGVGATDGSGCEAGRAPASTTRQGYSVESASWLSDITGKQRPIEPGIAPLAHGVPRRVDDSHAWARVVGDLAGHLKRAKRYRIGAIKSLGNAIVLPQATEWMRIVGEISRDA